MAARKRQFKCEIVNEVVHIHLRRRRGRGFSGEDYHFVQCDQTDCQYADKNEPPCPLSVDMFEDEILERQNKRDRSRGSD
jgi:hypothetical protein